MSITIERVSQPLTTKGLDEAFQRVLASDIEVIFTEMKASFGKEISEDVRSAVLTAQAFGDSVLVRVSSVAKGGVASVIDPSIDLDSLLSKTEVLPGAGSLDASALRDTVSSALEQALMNIEDLIMRARTQAY